MSIANQWSQLGLWRSSLILAYVTATTLSWVPLSPGVGRTLTRALLLTWMTASTVGWIMALARSPGTLARFTSVKRVVIGVGLCGLVAAPMMTRDLWCYVGFARLAADGINPYTTAFPDSLEKEMGGAWCGDTTTYGPLWTVAAAVVDRIVAPAGSTAELVALKGVLALAWVAMVAAVAWLYRTRDLTTRSVALATVAVVPISIFELVAEAHNDVAMMAFAMGWLVLRAKGSWLSPVPLACSALIKYVTAPLLVFSAIDAWRRQRYRESACALLAGTAIAIVAGGIWYQGGFSSLTTYNANWRWLSVPFAIELTLKNLMPDWWTTLVAPAVWTWRGLMLLGVAWFVRDWTRSRDDDRLLYGVLGAGMLALILSADYVWPWYLVWALPFVILAENRVLSAVAWPCFLVLPIAQASWAGGVRAFGYRTEIILALFGLIALAWVAQAWLMLRGQVVTLTGISAPSQSR